MYLRTVGLFSHATSHHQSLSMVTVGVPNLVHSNAYKSVPLFRCGIALLAGLAKLRISDAANLSVAGVACLTRLTVLSQLLVADSGHYFEADFLDDGDEDWMSGMRHWTESIMKDEVRGAVLSSTRCCVYRSTAT
jgi:hypothetical protein